MRLKSPPPNSCRRRQAEAAQVIDALNLKMAVRNSQSPTADDAIAQTAIKREPSHLRRIQT